MDEQFKKAQKPWAKLLNKVISTFICLWPILFALFCVL